MAARVESLVPWLTAARPPPAIAASAATKVWSRPNTLAASMAPAGMRSRVEMKSSRLSTPGILSPTNSRKARKPVMPTATGLASG